MCGSLALANYTQLTLDCYWENVQVINMASNTFVLGHNSTNYGMFCFNMGRCPLPYLHVYCLFRDGVYIPLSLHELSLDYFLIGSQGTKCYS